MKKTVCFICQNESTGIFIREQLLQFLEKYIEVKIWCLSHDSTLTDDCNADIYLASTSVVLDAVKRQLPADRKIIVADRTIQIENLDKLLAIEPNTQVIVIGTTLYTAQMAINIVRSFGINYLELIPYYPGSNLSFPANVKTAISTGLNHFAPPQVQEIVDLGVKGIDLSTFVELAQILGLPKAVLNEISHYYIEAIFHISIKLQKTVRVNQELKQNMEVILATVKEAIVAVNQAGEIILINPEAEKILELNSGDTIGRPIKEILPQIDISGCINNGESIVHDIRRIADNHFIIGANPIANSQGCYSGAVVTLRPIDEVQAMETKVRRTLRQRGNEAKHTFSDIVGYSPELKRVVDLTKKFAKTELTVLIEGESGTGKELFAQAVHNYSRRRAGAFVALNFAALPENLVESELFGYEDGAFTGAKKGGRPGLFEEAHQGTIFLDEIGDTTLSVQKKLLRVLEEREVRRIGGSNVTPVDVRVIAATNQNLEELVRRGEFRNDLYYRLCTLPINIPPLRERSEDIIHLLQYFTRKHSGNQLVLEQPLQDFLLRYQWPGNIRELQNVVKYLCSVVSANAKVTVKDLPAYLGRSHHIAESDKTEIRLYSEILLEQVVSEFKKHNVLNMVTQLLAEVNRATLINQGVGRQTLMKRMLNTQTLIPEHKIRYWLRALSKMGYIDSGVTRQGSKITKEGKELLTYIEKIAR